MRQVANVGALALDHILVMRHQGVELLGQRLQFAGIGFGQPLGFAATHVGDLAAELEQRSQADADLDDDGHDQAGSQKDESRGGGGDEPLDVAVDRAAVLGGEENHRRLAARQPVLLRADPQWLAQRTASVVGDGASRPGLEPRRQVRWRRQHRIEQGVGTRQGTQPTVRRRLGDLPVTAGKHAQRALVGERRGEHLSILDRRIGDQVDGEIAERLIDAPDRSLLEQQRQDRGRDDQGRETPAQRQ